MLLTGSEFSIIQNQVSRIEPPPLQHEQTRSHMTMVHFSIHHQPEYEKARSHLTMVHFSIHHQSEYEKARSHLTMFHLKNVLEYCSRGFTIPCMRYMLLTGSEFSIIQNQVSRIKPPPLQHEQARSHLTISVTLCRYSMIANLSSLIKRMLLQIKAHQCS
jgi:hypothetical protein